MLRLSINTPIKTSLTQSKFAEDLNRDGYVVIPNVLSQDEVKFLRTFFLEKFAHPETHFEGNDYYEAIFEIYERFEEIAFLLFKPPLIGVLKEVLGDDFVLLRGSSIMHNRYGWWWHKDTSNLERAGETVHHDPEYRQLLTAYYLQDNHQIFGGGLDAEPGSHLSPDPGFQAPKMVPAKPSLWARLLRRPVEQKLVPDYNDHLIRRKIRVGNRAGDLVIFDAKLNHRATQKKVDVVPAAYEKLAIFSLFSKNNHTVNALNNYVNNEFNNSLGDRQYGAAIKEQAKQIGMILS